MASRAIGQLIAIQSPKIDFAILAEDAAAEDAQGEILATTAKTILAKSTRLVSLRAQLKHPKELGLQR